MDPEQKQVLFEKTIAAAERLESDPLNHRRLEISQVIHDLDQAGALPENLLVLHDPRVQLGLAYLEGLDWDQRDQVLDYLRSLR